MTGHLKWNQKHKMHIYVKEHQKVNKKYFSLTV